MTNQKELAAFQKHVEAVYTEVYSGEDINDKAVNVVAFETSLAESMMAPAEMRVPERTYNKRSFDEASTLFGEFSFSDYMNEVAMEAFDTVIVGQPIFLEKIALLYEEKELADWKNYLTWKVIDHYADHLGTKMVELNFAFYKGVLSGSKEMKPLNDRVIDEITRMNFGEMLGKAFVEKHFSIEAKNRVNSMVDNLLAVYQERINALDWMTPETKKEALVKLNAIGRKLGYPEEWKDYSSLDFSKDDYVGNYRKSIQFGYKKNKAKLKKKWT